MNDQFEKLFGNFIKKSGAARQDVLHICARLNLKPQSDYLNVLEFTNGGEGFLQQSYFRLYSCEDLISLNEAYQVHNFAPGLLLFGSNGGGEAFGFDTRHNPPEIVRIPFIPMDFEYAQPLGKSFLGFLQALAERDQGDSYLPQIDLSTVGKEVHEIQPILFGGDPTDNKNKVLVTSEEHAKFSVFWNGVYQRKIHDGENT